MLFYDVWFWFLHYRWVAEKLKHILCCSAFGLFGNGFPNGLPYKIECFYDINIFLKNTWRTVRKWQKKKQVNAHSSKKMLLVKKKMRFIAEASQEYWTDIEVINRRTHIHDCYWWEMQTIAYCSKNLNSMRTKYWTSCVDFLNQTSIICFNRVRIVKWVWSLSSQAYWCGSFILIHLNSCFNTFGPSCGQVKCTSIMMKLFDYDWKLDACELFIR